MCTSGLHESCSRKVGRDRGTGFTMITFPTKTKQASATAAADCTFQQTLPPLQKYHFHDDSYTSRLIYCKKQFRCMQTAIFPLEGPKHTFSCVKGRRHEDASFLFAILK